MLPSAYREVELSKDKSTDLGSDHLIFMGWGGAGRFFEKNFQDNDVNKKNIQDDRTNEKNIQDNVYGN